MLKSLFELDKKHDVSLVLSILFSVLIALLIFGLSLSLYSVYVGWDQTTCFLVDSNATYAPDQFHVCRNNFIASDLDVYQGKVGPVTFFAINHNPLLLLNDFKWLLISSILFLVVVVYAIFRKVICAVYLNTSTIVAITAFVLWMYFKGAVIDVDVMAFSGDYASTGANPYELARIQGQLGLLPTFPYLPPCLILFSTLSYIRQFIELIGIPVKPYSVLSVFIGFSYIWLCFCLSKLLSKTPYDFGDRGNFFFFFLNPFGLYYVSVLTQLDIVAVSLFVFSMILLVESKGYWLLVLIASLMLFKLQHLPVILVSLFAISVFNIKLILEKQTLKFWFFSICSVLILFSLYHVWPSLFDSLSLNPQAKRIDWSVWWSYFDNLLIFRPVGFVLISFLLIVLSVQDFIKPTKIDTSLVCIFAVGIFTSLYQASFAHTFGMSAFIFPASCFVAVFYTKLNLMKTIFWYVFPITLLCTWGVGILGQGNMLTALYLYPAFSVPVKLGNWLFTIEYVSHLCYGFLLAYLLKKWSYISK